MKRTPPGPEANHPDTTFQQLWKDHCGWYFFLQQIEMEAKYGINPNATCFPEQIADFLRTYRIS